MIEPYNLTQEQRDAAHIKALEKQIADLITVVKMLAEKRIGVHFAADALLLEQNGDFREALAQEAKACSAVAANMLTESIHNFGELYEKLAQYEQWFYASNHGGRSMR